jgi:hypothetical protein
VVIHVLTVCDNGVAAASFQEDLMSKTGRKRRARKKNKANHGKRPNA